MFEKQIERGIGWLSENKAGWELKINFETLDMVNGCRCILGQVFAEEAAANEYLLDIAPDICEPHGYDYVLNEDDGLSTEWAAERGFTIHPDYMWNSQGMASEEAWRVLEEEWIREVKHRLDEGIDVGTEGSTDRQAVHRVRRHP
jgi:hypothetical protein